MFLFILLLKVSG